MLLLFDDPVKLFKKRKENLQKDILYLLSFSLFFVFMNELSIRSGIVRYKSLLGPLESIAVNYVSIITVFLICALIIYVFSGFRKSISTSFFVLIYSAMPLLALGWVPFAIIKVFALVWSAVFLTVGLTVKMGIDYRKSATITALVVAVIVILALLTQNYILTPIHIE